MHIGSDRKKELKRAYKERPKSAGVFQIKNTINGRLLLCSSLNLDTAFNKHRFALKLGSHRNKGLQKDWNEYGALAFAFEILETVTMSDDAGFNLLDELTLLEQIWFEQVRADFERGYNETEHIRQA